MITKRKPVVRTGYINDRILALKIIEHQPEPYDPCTCWDCFAPTYGRPGPENPGAEWYIVA